MINGQYIALFGKSENISAEQRRHGTLAGSEIADSGFGLIVSQLSGIPLYALRANKEAGGLSMGVVEQQHAEISLEHCDILLMVQDKQTMYERIAASSIGAIWMSSSDEVEFASEYFRKLNKPVFVLETSEDQNDSGQTCTHQFTTDIKKAISRFGEMAIAC